jgi:prepilin-type N-terminal cleavage/methylation domain-containing protein
MRRDVMKRQTEETGESRRGFTLVEVLIASFLFAVGMVAAMAMQYTALGGYTGARDLTNATEMAERVISIMKAESQQWRSGTAKSVGFKSVYATSDTYFMNMPLMQTLADSGSRTTWYSVFSEPVDSRMSDAGARRFCAYVRGGEMDDSSMKNNGTGIYQIQVVVVYPGDERAFPEASNSSTPFGVCDKDAVKDELNPPKRGSGPSDLELEGYRGVYMGTQIVERRYLDTGAKS